MYSFERCEKSSVQKLFLDVVDSSGQLTTMTLSASNSFGETTSIKSIFQGIFSSVKNSNQNFNMTLIY